MVLFLIAGLPKKACDLVKKSLKSRKQLSQLEYNM